MHLYLPTLCLWFVFFKRKLRKDDSFSLAIMQNLRDYHKYVLMIIISMDKFFMHEIKFAWNFGGIKFLCYLNK